MTTVVDDVVGRESRHVLQTYRRNAVTLVRGQGVRLYDAEGREYLDLLSGIGVTALGHAHPALARAIADQAQTLLHTSNLFYHPYQGQLAEHLAKLSGLPRAFFCNSGTEAVEACLKFARRYWHTKGEPRAEFIALEESFHGRTFGSLSVTSDPHYRGRSEPLPIVKFVPVNDPQALPRRCRGDGRDHRRADTRRGGIRPLTPASRGDHRGVRPERERSPTRFSAGWAEPATSFYFAALGLKPHLVSVGKARRRRADWRGARQPGGRRHDLVRRSREHLRRQLLACRAESASSKSSPAGCSSTCAGSAVTSSSGSGGRGQTSDGERGPGRRVDVGLELTRDAAPVVPAALERGVIVNRTAETVVRLLPPLVITETEADEALSRLDAALGAVGAVA